MINKVNYSADFETDDSVGVFKEFFRTNRGVTDYRLYSEYAGKTTHIASSMPISYFKTDMRKRLMKTVLFAHSSLNGTQDDFLAYEGGYS